ncbi:uncharacterized protein LOC144992515 [Oryzias latipes]
MNGEFDRGIKENGAFYPDNFKDKNKRLDYDDKDLTADEWMEMYEILERQVLAGIEKKQKDKEKEKLRKVWAQMDLKRTRSWMAFSQQLRQKEDVIVKQFQDLDEKVQKQSRKEKREAKQKQKEADETRRTLHQLTLAATAMATIKTEQESHKRSVTPSSPKLPLPGLYPSLPVGTDSSPVPFPPPYNSQEMYPMLKICGEIACDLEEELTPQEKHHIVSMLRERRTRMGEERADPFQDLINLQAEPPSAPRVSADESTDVYPSLHGSPAAPRGAASRVTDPKGKQFVRCYEDMTTRKEKAVETLAGQYTLPGEFKKYHRLIFPEQDVDKYEEEKEENDDDESPPHQPRLLTSNQDLDKVRRVKHSMTLRSGTKQHRDAKHMFPMIATGAGVPIYQPLPLKDVSTLAERLPRVSNGSRNFLQQLCTVMQGHVPCMGDLRQILGVTATVTEIQSIEQRAGVQDHPDSTLLVDVQVPVFTAIRELFPDPQIAAPSSFPYTGPFDVGSCSAVPPVEIQVTAGAQVFRPQYRWVQEADAGMEETLTGLWNSGVIEHSHSSWCTPLRPVLKADGKTYRMAHDLRAVNDVTITPVLPVPDPHRMLSTLTPQCVWFTAIDLANAFFCIPLHENSRHLFAFQYKGVRLQYTRLPQGFKNSPGIFNQCLKSLLQDTVLPEGCVLLMYVDDLLLAAPTADTCLQATKDLLLKLYDLGFKVSQKKLQCCRREVTFLGRTVSSTGSSMSTEHRMSILQHKRPETVREMLAFLGLCGYSRHFLPCFVERTAPLRSMIKEKGATNLAAVLDWTPVTDEIFVTLVQDMACAAALAAPDYTQPFFLDATMTPTVVNAVLFQKNQGRRDVLMYCSISLDAVEARSPLCTRYAAGLAKVILKTAHIVMSHPLIILTEHSVTSYVASSSFTLSSLRQTRLLKTLTAPNIQYQHTGINMSEGISMDPHSCSVAVAKELRTRPDLETKPLPEGRILFTDGCCFRSTSGTLQAAAAVVECSKGEFITLTSQILTVKPSAQAAEVLALCLALEAAPGELVTVYSDSAYAVSAALLDLAAWKRNCFLTARGEPIAHKDLMQRLELALQLPSRVAVVKVPGHSKGNTLTTRGNNAADAAAKAAAGYTPTHQMVSVYTPPELLDSPTHDDLVTLQSTTSPEQKSYWLQKGAVRSSDGLWVGPYGQPVVPDGPLLQRILKESHGPAHLGPSIMMTKLLMWWHPRLRDVCHDYVDNCTVCQSCNVRPTLKPMLGSFDSAPWPGAEVVIDYTDMINPVQGKRYLLVVVDSFSGWPEAYPCKREDSISVIKALVNHYIPTHGFPAKIRSDNGTHFNGKHLQQVEASLGLQHKFGCVYHPSSQGSVERMNRTLKEKLAKICTSTNIDWVTALPLALLAVRQSVNHRTGFSPFELLTGRLMPGPSSTIRPLDDAHSPNRSLVTYWKLLHAFASTFSAQVKDKDEPPAEPPGDNLADWTRVYLKAFKRKWSEPRWTGPYRVTARTTSAVQLQGRDNKWYHYSMLRPCYSQDSGQDA